MDQIKNKQVRNLHFNYKIQIGHLDSEEPSESVEISSAVKARISSQTRLYTHASPFSRFRRMPTNRLSFGLISKRQTSNSKEQEF